MISRSRLIVATIVLAVLSGACSSRPETSEIPGLAHTLAVRTLVAQQGVSYFATATPSPAPELVAVFDEAHLSASIDQPQPYPSSTPVSSLTPISRSLDSYEYADLCKNKAQFVADISFPDLTEVKPGQRFTKTWRMLNSGTCTWTPQYAIVFTYGDRMGGLSPKPIGLEVPPGEMMDISVDLVAPTIKGIYQGNWMFENEEGEQFGTSSGPNNFFWVAVAVGRLQGLDGLGQVFGICGGGG